MKKNKTPQEMEKAIWDAARRSPKIDLQLFKKWQSMMEQIEKAPYPPASPPEKPEDSASTPRLRAIPQRLFDQR